MTDLQRVKELKKKIIDVSYDLHCMEIDGNYYEIVFIKNLYENDEEIELFLYERTYPQNKPFTMTISQLAKAKDIKFYGLKEL